MIYNYGTGDQENWLVLEPVFNSKALGKCEVIMALGNGYMGMRSATEERYVGETRNTFIAGTFNRFHPSEVTELPNVADVFQMRINLNGYPFDLTTGEIQEYKRTIDLKTGELIRTVTWRAPDQRRYQLKFQRFVSLANHHLTGQKVTITALEEPLTLKLFSGIDGQMTNSGVQHFIEGERRLFNQNVLQLVQTTSESHIDVVVSSTHRFHINQQPHEPGRIIHMDRRQIFYEYDIQSDQNAPITLEKFSYFATSRDLSHEALLLDEIRAKAVEVLSKESEKGYDALLLESAQAWEKTLWSVCPIHIDAADGFDQLAIRFAQYHLRIMTPVHDMRMNIGAKGLTGEGYKGHTFWDTEIFILPYYSYTNPEIAKRLLTYRYLTLEGARRKAKENGYEGAMYPWESAWLADGEVTPVWGAADIVTGESTKIWSGFIEQHITADIAFAVWQYYQLTGDEAFMTAYGYEIIFETARFWCSRLEWSATDQRYHINQVVGPDEYKEHVDDNAFTNYMAAFNIQLAIYYSEALGRKAPEDWIYKLERLYLPEPQRDGVIPQDSTYLQKPTLDLTRYKNSAHVGEIFRTYNLTQVNALQVSKQADVMILMYLLENQFSPEVKKANWDYYEPKTLHDSSLSLSTHVIMATDLGHDRLAYDLFKRAAEIDLGPKLHSSDHGIHAASLGGLWQSIIIGFGGVRMIDGRLRINPHLPEGWRSLKFQIFWKGEPLQITITNSELLVEKADTQTRIEIEVFGKYYIFDEKVRIVYRD